MNLDDMVMVSIDDHVVEPLDIFERHFPASMKDEAPKLTSHPLNPKLQAWVFQGVPVGNVGLNAVASWPKEEWGLDPTDHAEIRPAVYDMDLRVRDMDANGTLASMLFATFPGFAGTHVASLPDKRLSLAALQAYNDWVVGEVPGAHPGRFIPMGIIPFFDMDASVREIHRLAAMGCRSVSLPETPYGIGEPEFRSGHWDPVFKAMVDTNMVVSLHIGGGFNLIQRPTVPNFLDPSSFLVDDLVILAALISTLTATDMMLSGVLKRFPDLRIAMSEGGLGWVPPWLDRMDRHMVNHSWTHLDSLPKGMTPTEVWRRNFLACYITEPSALNNRNRIGIDNIAWECDYPHSDTTWPRSPEMLWEEMQATDCTDAEIDKITHENVARFFSWDPFQHITKEQATVGALRARATDVDVSETSKAEYRRRYELAHA
ncbi:MAG: amidohydrolase family protein [Candidatus Nanopelagicales bacterium]|nr:amidohydrolase family protein [Candidatus Nanopelagicales bacterium]